MSIYTVFRHKIDIYNKTVEENESGQLFPTWALGIASQKCFFTPHAIDNRTSPTYEEAEHFSIFFPADAAVTYATRLYNLKDRYGNLIDAGPFLVEGIQPHQGFTGKIHHLLVKVKKVVET